MQKRCSSETKDKVCFAEHGLFLLTLEAKAVYVSEFGGDVLAVSLRRLEARLPDGFESFFVETRTAAFNDFRLSDSSLRIDFDSQGHVAFEAGAERHRWIRRARGLNRFGFTVGSKYRLLRWESPRTRTAAQSCCRAASAAGS